MYLVAGKALIFSDIMEKNSVPNHPKDLNDKFAQYQGTGSFALLTRSIISCFIIFSQQV